MKKSSKKKLKHKLPSLQYINTNCPLSTDVDDYLDAVRNFYKKNGAKVYRNDRTRADLLIRRLLTKHRVIGTISARFWYLEGICMLIQKTQFELDKAFKRAHKINKVRTGKGNSRDKNKKKK